MNRRTRRLLWQALVPVVVALVAAGAVDVTPLVDAWIGFAVKVVTAAGWVVDQLTGGASS